jgi:hypothetical protein
MQVLQKEHLIILDAWRTQWDCPDIGGRWEYVEFADSRQAYAHKSTQP